MKTALFNKNNIYKFFWVKCLLITFVLLSGIVMLLPVFKSFNYSILGIIIVGILFSPNICYSIFTIRSRFLNWIIIPAIFLCFIQIWFFKI